MLSSIVDLPLPYSPKFPLNWFPRRSTKWRRNSERGECGSKSPTGLFMSFFVFVFVNWQITLWRRTSIRSVNWSLPLSGVHWRDAGVSYSRSAPVPDQRGQFLTPLHVSRAFVGDFLQHRGPHLLHFLSVTQPGCIVHGVPPVPSRENHILRGNDTKWAETISRLLRSLDWILAVHQKSWTTVSCSLSQVSRA